MAIRNNFFRANRRAVFAHELKFFVVGVRLKQTFCAVQKSFRSQLGISRRLRLIQRVAAKFCPRMIFGQFDDFKVHAPQNFSNSLLLRDVFLRPPTILNRDCLAVMIRVGKIFVGQYQLPNRLAQNFGMSLLKNRRAVVTD